MHKKKEAMRKKSQEDGLIKAVARNASSKTKLGKDPKQLSLTAVASTTPWLTSIDDLVFYALDKASPYSLALNDQSNSMSKIGDLSLLDLMIDKTGLMILWTVINSGLNSFGRNPVAPSESSKCNDAKSVQNAANNTKPKV
jgi:hypothetical protein